MFPSKGPGLAKGPGRASRNGSGDETVKKLTALREELRKIERGGWSGKTGKSIALGLPEVDRLLSDETSPGLRQGCLHEFAGEGAEAFAAILSGRLQGPVLWCADALAGSELYPPGLAAFGLDYRRLIVARCRKPQEILAAMEDGLRCRALAAVVGELSTAVDLTASRRLQLAAESSGVTGFLVQSAWRDQIVKGSFSGSRKGTGTGRFGQALQVKAPSAAFSRWSVGAAKNSGNAPSSMTWRLSLHRCRNGGSGAWTVKWDAKAYRFSLAAEAADGQIDPPAESSSGRRLVG